MNYSDPLLGSTVTEAQRDRAVDYLQQAFAKQAITAEEFEQRLGIALTATTRAELNSSLKGLARVAPGLRPLAAAAMVPSPIAAKAENIGAGLTHLSGLMTSFLGPAVVKAASTPGTRTWQEAGRALSFQLTMLLLFVMTLIGAVVFHTGVPLLLGALGWLVGTILLSVRAFNGLSSTALIERFLPFKAEKQPAQLGR